ncbi:hypothetical protein MMC12_005895 [Toensbergia leucococca]|nr:hypothetical protein [Toensbergia leucococca]
MLAAQVLTENSTNSWELLSDLQIEVISYSHALGCRRICDKVRSVHLAKRTDSTDLFILTITRNIHDWLLFGRMVDRQEYPSAEPIAQLLPPVIGWVYRNFTATYIARWTLIRITVIWQDTSSLDNDRPILFCYDIVPKIRVPQRSPAPFSSILFLLHISLHHRSLPRLVSSSTPLLPTFRPALIQGKRISSLPTHTGGLHPSSSIWQHRHPSPTLALYKIHTALGGLRLFPNHPLESSKRRSIRDLQQRILVWGPESIAPTSQISVISFDFAASFSKAPDDNDIPHVVDCRCALHDLGFCVTLPEKDRSPRFLFSPLPDGTLRTWLWTNAISFIKRLFISRPASPLVKEYDTDTRKVALLMKSPILRYMWNARILLFPEKGR